MKIAIVDFDHYEMTYSLVRCLIPEAETITVYAKADMIVQLKKIKDFSRLEYRATDGVGALTRTLKNPNDFNFIFLNTLDSHFEEVNKFLDSVTTAKIIFTVHNVNYWFKMGTRFKIIKRPRSRDHEVMLEVLKKVDAFLVLSQNIKKYLASIIEEEKKIIVFPFSLYEAMQSVPQKNEKVNIVIPGTVEYGRKEYPFALDVFKQLERDKFRLQLLGKMKEEYGAEILLICQHLKSEGFDIEWFESYIEPAEFDKSIMQADIIFAPIKHITQHRHVEEIYGQSKETGAVFDLIRYAKPGIFPSEVVIPGELNSSVLTYKNSDDLVKIFYKLLDKNILGSLTQNALTASYKYTPEIIADQLNKQLNTALGLSTSNRKETGRVPKVENNFSVYDNQKY